jgi:DNA-binding PadR family transcriptional regulator
MLSRAYHIRYMTILSDNTCGTSSTRSSAKTSGSIVAAKASRPCADGSRGYFSAARAKKGSPMANSSTDPVDNLSTLALFIANDVRDVVTASFVTFLADVWIAQFSTDEQRRRFRTHPANSIIYQGLKALEERGIVRVHERLKDEHGLLRIAATVRRKGDVRLHRLALSHPATIDWQDRKMQVFAEAGREGYDWRPALVWDLQRSINEELRKHGRQPHIETVPVSYDMAVGLHAILNLSRHPSYEIPSVNDLFVYMDREVLKYQAALEKHPDGHRDLAAEKARAERRQRRREKWAQQAKDRTPRESEAGRVGTKDVAPRHQGSALMRRK